MLRLPCVKTLRCAWLGRHACSLYFVLTSAPSSGNVGARRDAPLHLRTAPRRAPLRGTAIHFPRARSLHMLGGQAGRSRSQG